LLQAKKSGEDDEQLSDADYVVQWMQNHGYSAKYVRVQALDYGSCVVRDRLYFVGFKCPGQVKALEVFSRILPAMKIGPISFNSVVGDMAEFCRNSQVKSKRPTVKQDCIFRDEHIECFRQAELVYPPDFALMPPSFLAAISGLTERQQELVIYAEELEPYPQTFGRPQFLDVNFSMKYLVGSGSKMIYSEYVPCLSTTSTIFMRVQLDEDTSAWRVLSGHSELSHPNLPAPATRNISQAHHCAGLQIVGVWVSFLV
jgi:hypothetical protein